MNRASLRDLLGRHPMDGLVRLARAHSARVALVGGAVRDVLLGLPVRDLDLIVEGGLEDFLDLLERELGRRPASIGDRFQDTHRFRWGGVQIDLARSLGPFEEDLGRRDFTVNALAVPLVAGGDELEISDPFGGLADLESGCLRETRPGVIEADPLRTLRAVRYAVSLPGFGIDASTLATVRDVAPALAEVAPERKVAEWAEILQLTRWREGLALAIETGVARHGLGALARLDAVDAWSSGEGEGTADARARFAALVVDLTASGEIGTIIERLRSQRWPRSLISHAARVARWYAEPDPGRETLARRALEDPTAAADAAELHRRAGRESEATRALAEFAVRACGERWVRGADLLQLGMEPGPELGALLEELAVGQVTGRWADAATALAWARGRIGNGEVER